MATFPGISAKLIYWSRSSGLLGHPDQRERNDPEQYPQNHGRLGKKLVQTFSLAAENRFRAAGDGPGHARALAGLQNHHGDQGDRQNGVDNHECRCHLLNTP